MVYVIFNYPYFSLQKSDSSFSITDDSRSNNGQNNNEDPASDLVLREEAKTDSASNVVLKEQAITDPASNPVPKEQTITDPASDPIPKEQARTDPASDPIPKEQARTSQVCHILIILLQPYTK